MSLAVVHSRALLGLQAPAVRVEVHLANGLPSFTLVGLADTEVKEARERVRAALLHSGLGFPHNRRIVVNLAPAALPKEGSRFDLPIALGILAANGQLPPEALARYEFAGELSLAGDLQPVPGALAIALALRRQDSERLLVLPEQSAAEAALVEDLPVLAARHLLDVVQALTPGDLQQPLPRAAAMPAAAAPDEPDLRDIRGQAAAKRALEIAAAGSHSLLFVGPPGTGKSMLALRLPGLLPPMHDDHALESAALWSLGGRFDPRRWRVRPFRAPHHTASAVALVGGGSPPRPGEISLAHRGTLFLDELPEFPRSALEALREPLESGHITIARAGHQAEWPARFQFVAAMNPCPCGHLGDPRRPCVCNPDAVARYRARISGPLLDRIDLRVEVLPVAPAQLSAPPSGEDSAAVRERVSAARQRQWQRQGCANADLAPAALERHATPDAAGSRLLQATAERLGWSGRGFQRMLRVARSVADLAGDAEVRAAHVADAVQWGRGLPLPGA
jgi:magnesium chelatase family protein